MDSATHSIPASSESDVPLFVAAGSIDEFMSYLENRSLLSPNTIAAYSSDVRVFARFMQSLGSAPAAASAEDVVRFLARPARNGQWRARSAARRLSCLRSYFGYLQESGLRQDNPAGEVKRSPVKRTPVVVLEQAELQALLAAPDVGSIIGLRDRAMLEVTYRCGLRVSEVVGLRYIDIDFVAGSLTLGAGDRKGTTLPVEASALYWLRRYIESGCAAELGCLAGGILFPSRIGLRMTRQTFWGVVRRAADRAGIDRPLTPRMLRLTLAAQRYRLGNRRPTESRLALPGTATGGNQASMVP